MIFTRTELRFISELGQGNRRVSEIANALKISRSQVYRISGELSKKGILGLSEGTIEPQMKTHVTMLLNLLSKAPNLSAPLSGTGLRVFTALLDPKTVREIEKETGLHKTTILKKIQQGRKMSLLRIENRMYRINEKIWSDTRECLIEIKRYEDSIDRRVPVSSVIYFKNDDEIVFSTKEDIDAEKTAFSAYEKFGIKLLLITNYYYLPKRHLTRKEVFRHSLQVIEKGKGTRELIFAALVLAKYKELSRIKHPIIENLNKVFSGEKVPGYPSLAEIRDRTEIYNIEV